MQLSEQHIHIIYGFLILVLGYLIYKHVQENHGGKEGYCGCAAGGGSDSETYVDRSAIHRAIKSCNIAPEYVGVL